MEEQHSSFYSPVTFWRQYALTIKVLPTEPELSRKDVLPSTLKAHTSHSAPSSQSFFSVSIPALSLLRKPRMDTGGKHAALNEQFFCFSPSHCPAF